MCFHHHARFPTLQSTLWHSYDTKMKTSFALAVAAASLTLGKSREAWTGRGRQWEEGEGACRTICHVPVHRDCACEAPWTTICIINLKGRQSLQLYSRRAQPSLSNHRATVCTTPCSKEHYRIRLTTSSQHHCL